MARSYVPSNRFAQPLRDAVARRVAERSFALVMLANVLIVRILSWPKEYGIPNVDDFETDPALKAAGIQFVGQIRDGVCRTDAAGLKAARRRYVELSRACRLTCRSTFYQSASLRPERRWLAVRSRCCAAAPTLDTEGGAELPAATFAPRRRR